MNNFTEIRESSIYGLMFKVIIIGDNDVGKSSIITRYLKNTFSENKTRTYGLDYKKKIIKKDNDEIIINFWDAAGHSEYKMIIANFLKDCSAIIVVFDITDKESINKLKDWKNIIDDNIDNENSVIILLGNKIDLIENNNFPIPIENYENLIEEYGWSYFELVSAKTNYNLFNVWDKLCEECLKKLKIDIKRSNILKGSILSNNYINKKNKLKRKKKCC